MLQALAPDPAHTHGKLPPPFSLCPSHATAARRALQRALSLAARHLQQHLGSPTAQGGAAPGPQAPGPHQYPLAATSSLPLQGAPSLASVPSLSPLAQPHAHPAAQPYATHPMAIPARGGYEGHPGMAAGYQAGWQGPPLPHVLSAPDVSYMECAAAGAPLAFAPSFARA